MEYRDRGTVQSKGSIQQQFRGTAWSIGTEERYRVRGVYTYSLEERYGVMGPWGRKQQVHHLPIHALQRILLHQIFHQVAEFGRAMLKGLHCVCSGEQGLP